jgi:hypothetical protein
MSKPHLETGNFKFPRENVTELYTSVCRHNFGFFFFWYVLVSQAVACDGRQDVPSIPVFQTF